MAGVKGKSGGPRANAGGARPGAGRKPPKPRKTKAKGYQTTDPDDFLRTVMADSGADFKDRLAAALALKKGGKGSAPQGKKEALTEGARALATRSLAPAPAPTRGRGHLRAVK